MAAMGFGTQGQANRADLDLAFGVDGVVELQLPGGSSFLDVDVQPDGRIVGVGYAGSGASRQWAVVRFTSDGSLDATFGAGGIVLLTPPGALAPTPPGGVSEPTVASSLAFDAAGNVLVVGGNAVVRLTPNGALDAAYGSGGVYIPPSPPQPQPYGLPGPFFRDIAPDGAGGFLLSGAFYHLEGAYYYAGHASVTRLTSAGVADTGFGTSGTAHLPGNYAPRTFSAAFKAVSFGGGVYFADYESDRTDRFQVPGVRKLAADGSFDTAFGSSGHAIPFRSDVGGPAYASSIGLQSGSRFVVAGVRTQILPPHVILALARITTTGQIDGTFVPFTVQNPVGQYDSTPTLLIDTDDRIVVGGWRDSSGAAIAGLLPDGAPDPDFGAGGVASLAIPLDGAPGVALARQSDGKYLVASGGDQETAAARMYVVRLRGSAFIPPEVATTPPDGALLSAGGGLPGTTQSLGAIRFTNRGSDALIVSNCVASSGFSAAAAFPLSITQSTPQSVAVSCRLPATPSTSISGSLVCETNDGDEPQLSFPLQCTSGLGVPGANSIPTLGQGMQWLLGALVALAALSTMRGARRYVR
ncbi:MAG TPA: delta-60 repeat domain-containing protein [Tahibacter sp.]|nr:delta-60 repeat domain-containing protein [Tahibacter sp.]